MATADEWWRDYLSGVSPDELNLLHLLKEFVSSWKQQRFERLDLETLRELDTGLKLGGSGAAGQGGYVSGLAVAAVSATAAAAKASLGLVMGSGGGAEPSEGLEQLQQLQTLSGAAAGGRDAAAGPLDDEDFTQMALVLLRRSLCFGVDSPRAVAQLTPAQASHWSGRLGVTSFAHRVHMKMAVRDLPLRLPSLTSLAAAASSAHVAGGPGKGTGTGLGLGAVVPIRRAASKTVGSGAAPPPSLGAKTDVLPLTAVTDALWTEQPGFATAAALAAVAARQRSGTTGTLNLPARGNSSGGNSSGGIGSGVGAAAESAAGAATPSAGVATSTATSSPHGAEPAPKDLPEVRRDRAASSALSPPRRASLSRLPIGDVDKAPAATPHAWVAGAGAGAGAVAASGAGAPWEGPAAALFHPLFPVLGSPLYFHNAEASQAYYAALLESAAAGTGGGGTGGVMGTLAPSSPLASFSASASSSSSSSSSCSVSPAGEGAGSSVLASVASLQPKRLRSASYMAAYREDMEQHDLQHPLPPVSFVRTLPWLADAVRSACGVCAQAFDALRRRRHHCRVCGDVVCGTCSSNKVALPFVAGKVRACVSCVAEVASLSRRMGEYYRSVETYAQAAGWANAIDYKLGGPAGSAGSGTGGAAAGAAGGRGGGGRGEALSPTAIAAITPMQLLCLAAWPRLRALLRLYIWQPLHETGVPPSLRGVMYAAHPKPAPPLPGPLNAPALSLSSSLGFAAHVHSGAAAAAAAAAAAGALPPLPLPSSPLSSFNDAASPQASVGAGAGGGALAAAMSAMATADVSAYQSTDGPLDLYRAPSQQQQRRAGPTSPSTSTRRADDVNGFATSPVSPSLSDAIETPLPTSARSAAVAPTPAAGASSPAAPRVPGAAAAAAMATLCPHRPLLWRQLTGSSGLAARRPGVYKLLLETAKAVDAATSAGGFASPKSPAPAPAPNASAAVSASASAALGIAGGQGQEDADVPSLLAESKTDVGGADDSRQAAAAAAATEASEAAAAAATTSAKASAAAFSEVRTALAMIRRDVPRSMPNQGLMDLHNAYEQPAATVGPSFEDWVKDCPRLEELWHLLMAYAVYPERCISYCQGMNYIACLVLVVLRGDRTLPPDQLEEQAFWMFASILEGHGLGSLFISDSPALSHAMRTFDVSLTAHMPAFAGFLASHSLASSMFSCEFLTTGMIYVLNLETTLRVWDVFLFEGFEVLYAFGLAITALVAPALISVSASDEILPTLRRQTKLLSYPDLLTWIYNSVGGQLLPASTSSLVPAPTHLAGLVPASVLHSLFPALPAFPSPGGGSAAGGAGGGAAGAAGQLSAGGLFGTDAASGQATKPRIPFADSNGPNSVGIFNVKLDAEPQQQRENCTVM